MPNMLDGNLAPERGQQAPLFSAHVYCGHGRPSQLLLSSCWKNLGPRLVRPNDQMGQDSTGRDVGLSTGDTVLHGTQLPRRKGAQQPHIFRRMAKLVVRGS